MKDKKIQGRVIVFISGKMISTGGKNIRNSVEQLKHTVEILAREKIIKRTKIEPKVQNVVATQMLEAKLISITWY